MLGRLSLRARLILAVIVLAAVGLVSANFVTYSELRSFEFDRIDTSLDAAHSAAEGALFRGPGPDFHAGNAGPAPTPVFGGGIRNAPIQNRIGPLTAVVRGYYVEVRRANGTVLLHGFAAQVAGEPASPLPALPKTIDVPSSTAAQPGVAYFTVHAVKGGSRYRVRASVEQNGPNPVTLILAAPLSGVDSTLHRLLLIEILATAAVLFGIAALGLWVVRLGLRPLDEMGKTAAAIAAGDLSRRVERADDRTEVGQLGLALNKMLANIETAVTDRDTSLKALEASESKLRRFVADASHELRTPLAAVRAYAELFTRGAADRPGDLERSMTGISRESERMSVLVEDLLLLAHLDEGRPLELAPVELQDVVEEALETARTLEPNRPIEAHLDKAVVEGDRDRLRQIVDNLLSNVRSHTPPEAPLAVTLSADESSAILTIADSGPGLDPEQLTQVFERFYRADPSRARTSGGAGLGLAIVAAVVDAHGGSVGAESVPGKGTTFRVEIPLHRG